MVAGWNVGCIAQLPVHITTLLSPHNHKPPQEVSSLLCGLIVALTQTHTRPFVMVLIASCHPPSGYVEEACDLGYRVSRLFAFVLSSVKLSSCDRGDFPSLAR